jgi:threonine aldolase
MESVDLRSDTVTRPSPEMKRAMMTAELGDDVLGDDPTVKQLEAEAARISGKEAAIFVPSGTMANQIAIVLLTRPGDIVLMEAGSHPFNYESAGTSVNAGVLVKPLIGKDGVLEPASIAASVPPDDPHFAPPTLLCVEDTANKGGGTVHPLDRLDELAAVAHDNGMKVHMDGARAFNAVVESGVELARRARDYDTISFCLSKGLGAPVGSMLCGSAADMHRAKWARKRMGGAMRQSGILAAAGLYALEHNIGKLADDHRRARELSMAFMMEGFDVKLPATNIIYVGVHDGAAMQTRFEELGVRCLATGPRQIRLVLHLDIDDDGLRHAINAVSKARSA